MSIDVFFTEKLLPFFQSLINLLVTPIFNIIKSIIPVFNFSVFFIQELFDLIKPYLNYVLDMFIIDPLAWQLLLGTIIYKVSSKIFAYIIKISVKWWHYIH